MKIFAASAGGLRPKDTTGHFFLPKEGGRRYLGELSSGLFLSGALRLNTSEKTEFSYIGRRFAFWDCASRFCREHKR